MRNSSKWTPAPDDGEPLSARDQVQFWVLTGLGCLLWLGIGVVACSLVFTPGCGRAFSWLPDLGSPDRAPPPPGSHPNPFWWLPWIGFACAAFGVVTLLLGTVIPFVPRKTSGAAILIGVACGLAQWFLQSRFFPWAVGLGALAVLVALYPWVRTWFNLWLDRAGIRLAGTHPDAAVALRATARGLTRDGDKRARRALMVKTANGVATTGGTA